MNEFIEKLIGKLSEEIKKINDEPCLDCEERIKKQCIYCNTIKIVNELAEEHNGGWIPCSERLPEKDCYYLITSLKGRVYEAYYQDGFWLDPIEFYGVYRSVTAWQPLPAPYNPKGE